MSMHGSNRRRYVTLEVLFWLEWCDLAMLPILGSEALKIGKIVGADGFVCVLHGCQKISYCDITGYNLKKIMHTPSASNSHNAQRAKNNFFYPKSGDRIKYYLPGL